MDETPLSILLFCLSHMVQFNSILTIIYEPKMLQKKVFDPHVPLSVSNNATPFDLMRNVWFLPDLTLSKKFVLHATT